MANHTDILLLNVTLTTAYNGYNPPRNYSSTETPNAGREHDMLLKPLSLPHLLTTSIILGLIILATIIGNVFVIAAIVLEKNLQSVNNYLIVSLAVADLMVSALVMPLAAVNEVSTEWFLGNEICDMWISFDVLCCTSSILHLVAIAMDRYWAVTRVDYIRERNAKRIIIMIVLVWSLSCIISIPPLFGWKDARNNPSQSGMCLISQDWGYTVFSTGGAFYLPLLLMTIIYIKIFRAAKSRIRKKNFKPPGRHGPRTMMCPVSTECTSLTQVPSSISDSPDHSINGSAHAMNDANRNHCGPALSPPCSPLIKHDRNNHLLDMTKIYIDGGKRGQNSSPKNLYRDRNKEKLEQKRERKAARTLAIITGTFVCCWLPFFIVAIVRPFCGDHCVFPKLFISIILWLGYLNSFLNPIIYTIFNPDFRSAFRKILFGKYRRPNAVR